jgi:uncharacterized protein YacL
MIIATRIVLIILGALTGFKIADSSLVNYIGTDSVLLSSSIIFFGIIAGGGLGYIIGGIVGRAFQEVLNWLTARLHKMSGVDLVIGVIGLVVGLLIAFFMSFGLMQIPQMGPYLIILTLLIMGYLGAFSALRKKDDLAHFLHISSAGTPGSIERSNPKIIDTSTIIDGRIIDIYNTGFIEGAIVLPQFVLNELQNIADSSDSLRRNRGRRGLDILNTLQNEKNGHIQITQKDYPDIPAVDSKLVQLAKDMRGTIVTVDYNLNKVARLQGVLVLNVNELANALKTIVLPGEDMRVKVVREGKEHGQGLGYLDDGTMIVVEDGRKLIGKDIDTEVTSVLQTPAGRMVFVKPKR